MSKVYNLSGVSASLELGKGGPAIEVSGAVVEVHTAVGGAKAVVRGADPVGVYDFVTKGYTGSISGSAAAVTLVDDVATNAEMDLLWATGTGGNYAPKTSAAKLHFNPSSGLLTASGFSGPLSGNATTASNLSVAGAKVINIQTSASATSGISWYSNSYTAWSEYMASPGAGQGPTGTVTAPSGVLVTSYALRSFVENTSTYGWIWESGSTTSTTPSVVAEIRASDGAARFGGFVTTGGLDRLSTRNPFGDGSYYNTETNNVFFRGESRFTVTGTGFSTFVSDRLFDGYYESVCIVDASSTGVIDIDLTAKSEFPAGQGIVYSQGYFYLCFYHVYPPASVSGRVKDKDGTWYAMTGAVNVSKNASYAIWRLTSPAVYYVVEVEFTIVAQVETAAWICELEYWATRPAAAPYPMVSKYAAGSLYNTLSFRNSSNVVKASIAATTGIATFAGIVMADGATIGQATGPLIAFDDTNNYLEITNCMVGIVTTAPTASLDVCSATMALPNTSGTTQTALLRVGYYDHTWAGGELDIGCNTGSPYQSWIQSRKPTDFSVNRTLLINPNGGDVLFGSIVAGGKIGINTATPFVLFQASSNQTGLTTIGTARVASLHNTSGIANELIELGFGYSTANYSPVVIGQRSTSSSGNLKGDWYVATRNVTTDTAPTERFTVKDSGYVGIGTNAPGAILDVRGSTSMFGATQGQFYTAANTLNFNYGTNADAAGWVNYYSYGIDVTQFRDLIIGNGKGVQIAIFDGSTGYSGFGNITPAYMVDVSGAIRCSTGFGCNGATPQTAYVAGVALDAYSGGAYGFDSAAHAQALYNKVMALDAALQANGVCKAA